MVTVVGIQTSFLIGKARNNSVGECVCGGVLVLERVVSSRWEGRCVGKAASPWRYQDGEDGVRVLS